MQPSFKPGAIVTGRGDHRSPGGPVAPGGTCPAPADALRRARPLLVPGVGAVTLGGLVAAGSAHAPTPAAVWLAAYLVLVVGVAQLALALGQSLLVASPVGHARIRAESLLFNLGSAGVIAGAIGDSLALVALGSVLFVAALAVFLHVVRGASHGYAAHGYRILIVFLALSAVVGLFLSAGRT